MRRRIALVATLSVVVAACGSGEPETFSISAGWSANSPETARLAGDSSGMTLAPSNIEYRLADGVERPASKARAWRATAPGDAKSRLQGLADAFDVDGEPVETSEGFVAIGTDRRVTMSTWSGMATWSYEGSFGASRSAGSGAVSPPCDPTAGPCDTVPSPTPPTDLISTSDAEVKARRILGAAGYRPDQMVLTPGSSEWETWVDTEETAGGVVTGITGRIGFGSGGEVMWAYGQFSSLERGDEYPLVDLGTAVERLTSPMYALGMARGDSPEMSPVASDTATSDVTGDTVPVEPMVITITSVEVVLQVIPQSETASLLVPSYRFSDENGIVGIAVAVEDKYVDTTSRDTSVSEPGSGTGVPEPVPAPDELAPIPQSDADTLIGLTEGEAVKVAEGKGWAVRVAERDGEQLMLTADFVPMRVNLTVTRDKVTAVSVG